MTDIQSMLERWGKSAALGHARHLYYPGATPFARLLPRQRKLIGDADGPADIDPLDDADHIALDRVVSQMRHTHPQFFALVVMYYRDKERRTRVIARAAGCKCKDVHELLRTAEAWIENKL